jgi:hypothetical protein
MDVLAKAWTSNKFRLSSAQHLLVDLQANYSEIDIHELAHALELFEFVLVLTLG